MSKAAKKLFISQSAVSQAIAELESEYGVTLFDRSHRKLHLTYGGQMFLSYGREIFNLSESLRIKMQEVSSLHSGCIKIGASTTIGTYLLPKIIAAFQTLHPHITVSLAIHNSDLIEQMVLDYQLDMGFVEGDKYSPLLTATHLIEDRLCLICSSSHSFVRIKRKFVSIDDLRHETIILREKGSGTRKILENILQEEHLSFANTHEMHTPEAIKNSVRNGLGISFLSRLSVSEELQEKKLCTLPVPFEDRMIRSFSIITRSNMRQSPLLCDFLDYVQAHVDS